MVMCQWVQNRIPAYLSGELGSRPAKWLLWHIKQCHVCQRAMEVLKGVQDIVAKALPTNTQAPETLTDRVMTAIDRLPPVHAPPLWQRWRWWRR